MSTFFYFYIFFLLSALALGSLPLVTQTESTTNHHHHQTQPGPDGSSPLLPPPRIQELSQIPHSPGPRTDPDPRQGGPNPRQDLESASLSSLLDEIVFLNQKAVAMATSPQRPERLALRDSGVPRQPDSVDPGLIETPGNRGEQPGPDSNTNCGVLAPPPLLHMRMGGAKASSEDAAGDRAGGGRGGGGVGWRPMPRLVPLGVRGNSPS